jgi:hypothetical protein
MALKALGLELFIGRNQTIAFLLSFFFMLDRLTPLALLLSTFKKKQKRK